MGIRQRIDVSVNSPKLTVGDIPYTWTSIAHAGQALLSKANSAQAKDLLSSYELLTSRDKMGERFKFLTITSSHTHIPTPFSE